MKTYTLILVCSLFHFLSNAQHETRHWCFGTEKQLLFDTNSVQVLQNSAIYTEEAASSISDANGNLLFYTDGISVWNKQHQMMANGNGLVGHTSTTQCLIVKRPMSDSIYYIFYADAWGGANGAHYAIVDLSLNAGLGSVISKNNLLFTPSSEKFTAVKHSNGIDSWVMTRTINPRSFRAYLLTANGLDTVPVISPAVTTTFNNNNTGVGQMKFSHNGKLLALGNADSTVFELLDFDASTGVLTNSKLSKAFRPNYPFGIEFSPNDSILYGTLYYPPVLLKFDLAAGGNPLLNYTIMDTSSAESFGALQLAIDGKIYVGRLNTTFNAINKLGVIQYPNSWTLANYHDNGLVVNNTLGGRLGLPNFEQSLLRNVKPDLTTSVKDITSKSDFTVYPNPFTQKIIVSAEFKFSELRVHDMLGKTVFRKQIPAMDISSFDLNELRKGTYFLTISSKKYRQTKLVIRE